MITWRQLGFQDRNSFIIEEFLFFHDFALVILTIIITFVGVLLISVVFNTFLNKNLLQNQILEVIWTIIPAIILISLAIPSLSILYTLDETTINSLGVKIIGNQWYWRYEYQKLGENFNKLRFDSYIISNENSSLDTFRLLDVDNRVILPLNIETRLLVSASDVLHSWRMPALGLKIDACPGRINQINFFALRPGVFFGQCSEICGANHRFIPISLEIIKLKDFLKWWRINN